MVKEVQIPSRHRHPGPFPCDPALKSRNVAGSNAGHFVGNTRPIVTAVVLGNRVRRGRL